MATSKLYKPNYSYGSTKNNYSESHQDYSTQAQSSSWAKPKQPNYNYPAHENNMARSIHGGCNDSYGLGLANKSTNYYAQAQCAQPSPVINVVQTTHVVKTLEKQESIKGSHSAVVALAGAGAAGSLKCASSAQAGGSELAMHQEEHIMGKLDQGWAKKPNCDSGSGQLNQYGLEMHKEEHMMSKMDQGWANKPTQNTKMGLGNQYGQSMYKEQEEKAYNFSEGGVETGWATKPTKYLGSSQSNNSINTMYNEHDQDGYGPIQGNNTGLGVHKEDLMMAKTGQGWANSPMTTPHSNQSNVGMYNDNDDGRMMGKMGLGANSTTNFGGPTKTNNLGLQMYKEEHMMGKSDHAYVSPIQGNQFGANNGDSANQLGYSAQNMYKEQGQTGLGASQVNHAGLAQNGFGADQNSYGSTQLGHAAHGVSNNGYGSAQNSYGSIQVGHSAHSVPNNGYGSAQSNYSAHSGMGSTQNGYGSAQGGMGSAQNGYGSAQSNHSAYGVANNGFGSAQTGYGGTQGNHSALGVTQNGFGSAQANHSAYGATHNAHGPAQVNYSAHSGMGSAHNGFGSAQVNNSGHSVAPNGFGSAQANYSAQGAAHNGYGSAQSNYSAQSAAHNGFGSAQANYSAQGAAHNGFGSAQSNFPGHGSNNYQDHHEDHEGIHDIMDEILTKYPAHNVSGGGNGGGWAAKPGPYVSSNQSGSYAKQQSFGGPAQQGFVKQSSNKKFEMKNEVNAGGYMANMKNEFSHSSSSNKFEVKGHLNNHNRGVGSDDESDF
ncbi:hypothetical protein RND81_03G137700 [Saponaria officinalis]|uniref:Uncharacterized protein n=1 Tax=Saponaria officinalis TaxID=3572 RepID=A0AAW1M8K5_SAPOF